MIAVRVLLDGVVVRERLLGELPIRIGRDADCEVPLADESVSRLHARIVAGESGTPVLEDAGSRNGIHVGPRAQERLELRGRVRCRLGRVELELEPVSDAPTEEIDAGEWRRYEQRRSGLHALGYLASAVAAWLALEVLAPGFWSPLGERRGLQLAGSAVGGVIAIGACAFGLLVALRAVGRRVRIADALQGLARVAWVWPGAALLGLLSYYLLTPDAHVSVVGWIHGAATALTVGLIAVIRRSGPGLRVGLAWGIVGAAVYAGLGLTEAAEQTAAGAIEVSYVVQAPIAGWTGPAVDADAYFARVEAAFRETARSVE